MIYLYDIARDEERHPTLTKIKSFNVKKEITSENDSLVRFIHEYLKVDSYDNEHMFLLALDMYDRSMGVFLLGIGDYKNVDVFNRNVAECLILSGARRFILVHNHPDGALFLSDGDKQTGIEMKSLGEIFDIKLVANCVVTEDGFIADGMEKPILF